MSDIVNVGLVDTGVLTVRLNRPEVLNSLNRPIVERLIEVLNDADKNEAVRAIIVTGEGRGFCAGADLANGQWPSKEGWSSGDVTANAMETAYNPLVRALVFNSKPVITAVNGIAAGGGVGIALAGDIVIAGESAKFKLVFARQLGIISDLGSSWMLPNLVGRARANGMALLGDDLSAEKAAEWGLIWEVLPDDKLMETATAYAERLADGAITGIKASVRAHDQAHLQSLDAQLDYERDMQHHFCDQPVFAEGVRAFIEKRKPDFRTVETEQIRAKREKR